MRITFFLFLLIAIISCDREGASILPGEPLTVRVGNAEETIKQLERKVNTLEKKLSDQINTSAEQRQENWRRGDQNKKGMEDIGVNIGNLTGELRSEMLKLLPRGTILPYSGKRSDLLPDGWVFCDGSRNGVPNLKGHFLRGAESVNSGRTGGNDKTGAHNHYISSHKHSISSHNHSFTTNSSSISSYWYHKNSRYGINFFDGGGARYVLAATSEAEYFDKSKHSHSGTTSYKSKSSTGPAGDGYTSAGGEHDNRPKYYTVHYIMKIK